MRTEYDNQTTPVNPAKGELVLIVEDNQANQDLLLQQLTVLGYSVETSVNGQEALEKLQQEDFRLILTDLNMPIMDGYQLTQQIRLMEQRNSDWQKHIIIAITANALAGEKDQCLQSGMDDYLSKPINIFDLKSLLEEWI